MRTTSLQLLRCLRQNAWQSKKKLGEQIGIPPAKVLHQLKKAYGKCIERSTILFHFRQLGYAVNKLLFIHASSADKEKMVLFFVQHDHINAVYTLTGTWDFALESFHRTQEEFNVFLRHVRSEYKILDCVIYDVATTEKREGFLPTLQPRKELRIKCHATCRDGTLCLNTATVDKFCRKHLS
jgi:DNA-binding Lrp family transcriptional regulator